MNPFSRFQSDGGGSELFDERDEFVPDSIPGPDPFLDGHDVLVGDDHLAFHDVARDVFEERGVYDATFGYNLAKLNRDRRHPGSGFRYAVEADDRSVLRATFTPTTPFCPQADALTKGAFRAWNGLEERHEYDLVRVRVHPMHHGSERVNDELADLELTFRETGTLGDRTGGGFRDALQNHLEGTSDDESSNPF